jgi:TRAP-type C4-dicarboxylate transport system substrate-binding protein
MGAAWSKATSDRVTLRVFPGTFPSEKSIIGRMGLDGLEAATLMVAGLGEIDPAFNIFGIPFFFESDAELEYVQQKLTPMLSQKLEAKKYRLLGFGNGGWVRLFSKMPIRTLAELKAAKLYTTEGDAKSKEWYANNGFNAVELATPQIKPALMSPIGAINATPSPPAFAVALQFYKDAPYMLDLKLGPLTGATVMTERAWAKISPEDREQVLAGATAMGKTVNAAAPGLDTKSIEEMKKATLKVVTLTPAELQNFLSTAEKLTHTQRGFLVPADVFDAAIRERDAFRKTKR